MKLSMKRRCLLCSVLFAGALALTGCGEEPYELEDNERGIIVNYAAHIIAKYNKKQPEGYRYVYVPEEEEEAEPEEKPEKEKEPEETDGQEDGTNETDGTQQPKEPAQDEEPSVTLTEALGLSGVQAVYTGAELTDSYGAAVPEDGKKLLVLHVTLRNEGSKDEALDMVSVLPSFRATVNGTEETSSEITILPDDLGTWEGTVAAGSSQETVILFQVSGQISSVEQLEMKVTAGKNTSRVVFL